MIVASRKPVKPRQGRNGQAPRVVIQMTMTDNALEAEVRIPAWVTDLKTFRRWSQSADFPQEGRIDFLSGEIWVDLNMEEFLTHNQVKQAIYVCVSGLVQEEKSGRFIPDRMRMTHIGANYSTEPDGAFATWETFRTHRLRRKKNPSGKIMELVGAADMVMEILSDSSVEKDTVLLRDHYWKAGVSEFWLVDVRDGRLEFTILRHTERGFVPARKQDGWQKSNVFGRSFRLTKTTDPLGEPFFTLEVKPV